MARPVTLFTGQWADLSLEVLAQKVSEWGFDGLELACWGDHFEVDKALASDRYVREKRDLLEKYNLKCWAISTQRCADEVKNTARAAAAFGVNIVNGFTGSAVWHLIYSFPPNDFEVVEAGYQDFADRWNPIMDVFDEVGVKFGLEVHPTEIAYDFVTTEKTLEAIGRRPAFGINFDPSHFAHQFLDPVAFIEQFADRIYHVPVKDSKKRLDGRRSILGSHLNFGEAARGWDFVSPGHGDVEFEEMFRALNRIGYDGPLSIEWEDSGMDRDWGGPDALAFVRRTDFAPSQVAFDAAFASDD